MSVGKHHIFFGVVKGQCSFERIPGNEMLGLFFLAKVLTSPREGISEGCSYANLITSKLYPGRGSNVI